MYYTTFTYILCNFCVSINQLLRITQHLRKYYALVRMLAQSWRIFSSTLPVQSWTNFQKSNTFICLILILIIVKWTKDNHCFSFINFDTKKHSGHDVNRTWSLLYPMIYYPRQARDYCYSRQLDRILRRYTWAWEQWIFYKFQKSS